MRKITEGDINELLVSEAKSPAITIYLPTHISHSPPNISEDMIRFKNLRNQALNVLVARDKHEEFNKEFMQACERLLEDMDFWEHVSESVLICARPGLFEYHHLPIDSEEYVAVADHFYLAPVLGLCHELRAYYVLCLALHHPTLFRGDSYGLEPTSLQLPESVEKALRIDERYGNDLRFSTTRSPAGAQAHGRGGGRDTADAEQARFFKMVDDEVFQFADRRLPMILAGTSPEIAEYRSLSRYPHILEGCIDGHFGADVTNKLHERAKAIIDQEIIAPKKRQMVERFEQLRGQNEVLASERIAELADAADKGRIGTLLIGMSRKTRDTVKDTMRQVRKLVFPDDNESQAIDYLARQVAHQSGEVINVPLEEMPSQHLVLSINRY